LASRIVSPKNPHPITSASKSGFTHWCGATFPLH